MSDVPSKPDRSPVSGSGARRSSSRSERRLRLALVGAMYAIAVATGVMGVLRPEHALSRLVLPIAVCSVMGYWCVVDSRMQGSPIVQSVHWIIFFTWPVAVPVYLIWSRRLRGLGLALIHAIGLYGVCFVAYHATGYVAYGKAWLDALRG